ncbi:MAG: TonB family protein [Deltaproteobacteria bacterium]|nr:TonB family protein [Deltaproteobacteria bacterium]
MFNENLRGIRRYYVYSALFHLFLIGLIVYLSIRYKPEIQSIGSNVVVSVVSSVPGPPASVRAILKPPAPKANVKAVSQPAPAKKPARLPASMVYPKKVLKKVLPSPSPMPAKRPVMTPVPAVNSNVYTNLHNMVSLNNAYSRVQKSLVRGNIHKFQGYVNKIVPIIMSHFNISLSKYLHYKSVVAIQISGSGRIYGVRLVKSSGNGYFDSQSVEAAKSSNPLPPPPKGFMSFVNSNNAGEGALIVFNPKEILKNK